MALVNNAVTIQGNQLNIAFRVANTGVFKYAVCQSAVTLKNTVTTNTVDTNCGALTSVGISPRFSGSVNLVFNANPDLTVDLSTNEFYAWENAGTLLEFQIENPITGSAGSNILRQGQCYITDVNESFDPNKFLEAVITFTGNGTLTASGV